jgi:protein TonB
MAIELIPLEETHVETTTEVPAATADVVPPDAPTEPKKGKGRPPGSKNKSKSVPEVAPPEPVPEPVVEPPIEPAPIPIEKKKRQARVKIPPESLPEAAVEVPIKKRPIRAPAPAPPPSSPIIAVIPDRPRPEDMLRQLQQDARQRVTDSYNLRREGWTAELNSKYK